jgi:type I restriction enzyme, S subunit
MSLWSKTALQSTNLTLKIPSEFAIAEILSDMDAEIAVLEGKLSKARLVKQGMMSELLTGKVRLV